MLQLEDSRPKPATLSIRMADGRTFRVEGTINDAERASKLWKVVDLGPGLRPAGTYWLNPDLIAYIVEVPGDRVEAAPLDAFGGWGNQGIDDPWGNQGIDPNWTPR